MTGELKEPIVISKDSPGPDYTEQTEVKALHDTLCICPVDNMFHQDKIREAYLAKTWPLLTAEERNIVIDMAVGENHVEKATHLFTTGVLIPTGDPDTDNGNVESYLTEKWLDNYPKNKEACKLRINSKALDKVIGKFLTLADAEDLQHTVGDLERDYEKRGIRGVAHFGLTYGLIDYFNGTPGTPYENQSIKDTKSYTMKNGDPNMDNFVSEILDVLLFGNY